MKKCHDIIKDDIKDRHSIIEISTQFRGRTFVCKSLLSDDFVCQVGDNLDDAVRQHFEYALHRLLKNNMLEDDFYLKIKDSLYKYRRELAKDSLSMLNPILQDRVKMLEWILNLIRMRKDDYGDIL